MASTESELVAAYIDARSSYVRRIVGWGLLVLVVGALTLAWYLSAQAAAENPYSSEEERTYFVLWGPMIFAGWKAIQAGVGLRGLNAVFRSL